MEILMNFMLFGLMDYFILLMLYKEGLNIEKIEYKHLFLLCPIYFIIGVVPIPFINQIFGIVINILYIKGILKYENSTKNIVLFVVLSYFYLLIIETIFFILYIYVFKIDILEVEIFLKFIYMIPMRLVEILFIKLIKSFGGVNMGWIWWGEIEEDDAKEETEEVE